MKHITTCVSLRRNQAKASKYLSHKKRVSFKNLPSSTKTNLNNRKMINETANAKTESLCYLYA